MKHAKWLLILILLASLALGLAACGDKEEPTSPPAAESTQVSEAEPTAQTSEEPTKAPEPASPTDTPQAEPTAEPEVVEEEFDASSLSSAAELSSYRSTMRITTMTDKDGQEETQTLELTTEYTSEPLAQHMTMSGATPGADTGEGTIEMYFVGDKMYMKMGEDWLSMPATEEDIENDAVMSPDSLLADLCGWKKEGREEIDGVEVQHWSFTKEDYDRCTLGESFLGVGELTDAGGDLYVAEDENYVALMDLFYEGEDLDLGLEQAEEGTTAHRIEIHYEMSDVNVPFIIEVPAEALEAGSLPEDIPVPDDAVDVNNMFGMISFTSAMGAEAVFAYYQEEMPNNGWTEASAEAMTGLWMAEYTKGDRTANFMITEDDEGNASVLITLTEPE